MERNIDVGIQKKIVISNVANVLGFVFLTLRELLRVPFFSLMVYGFFLIGMIWGIMAIADLKRRSLWASNSWQVRSAFMRVVAALFFLILTYLAFDIPNLF